MLSLSRIDVAAFVLQPIAADRTTIECQLLFTLPRWPRRPSTWWDAVDFWHMVNLQDGDPPTCAARMASRSFEHGWYAPMEDPSLDIRRWWKSKMNRGGAISRFSPRSSPSSD